MRLFYLSTLITSGAIVHGSNSPPTLHLQRRTASNSTQLPVANAQITENQLTLMQQFDVNVTIGNQTVPLLMDTGSSDIWVLGADWICLNDTSNATLPQEACGQGPETFQPGSSFQPAQDAFFGEQLGGGRVSGIFGQDEVTLGGITVKDQYLGVVNKTSNTADGVNVGIVGFGFPVMTSAHNGSIENYDNTTFSYNAITYNPLFYSMAAEGLIDPYFSMALERTPLNATTGPGGYLTLGGLPPVSHSPNFSQAPVQTIPLPANLTGDKPNQRAFWAINIDGVAFGPASSSTTDTKTATNNLTTNTTTFPAVIDSGNFFNFLAPEIVNPVNALCSPPGQWNPFTFPPTYTIDCAATPPSFGYTIGNQTFFHNGADLVYNLGDGTCCSSLISSEGTSLYGLSGGIIGDPFLKNVVAVFDYGEEEMRFAARTGDGDGSASSSTTTSSSSGSASTGAAAAGLVPREWFVGLSTITVSLMVMVIAGLDQIF